MRTIKILMDCTNSYYVSPSDKKNLAEDNNPLERSHLRYLLTVDPEFKEIFQNRQNVEVFMQPFLFQFGLFSHTVD
jgi:hypothetical protein